MIRTLTILDVPQAMELSQLAGWNQTDRDWQRVLLPILLEIAPKTQFIVATHAATIYSSYPNHDIWLDKIIQEEATV